VSCSYDTQLACAERFNALLRVPLLTGNALGQVGAEELRNGGLASSQRVANVIVMVDRAFEVTFVSLGLRDYPVRYVPVRGGGDVFGSLTSRGLSYRPRYVAVICVLSCPSSRLIICRATLS
jgi:hypothetical protein